MLTVLPSLPREKTMVTARHFANRLAVQSGNKNLRMTIIGDVRFEMRVPLKALRFTAIDHDTFCFAPIQKTVAGTAVNMAKAAQSLFTTAVIAKIGDDELTQLIKDQAGRIDADWHLIVDAQTANGLVVIVRDAADEKHGGNRLLVSGLPAPGLRISTADIHTEALLIEQSDVLMIDGYSLLSQSGREALMEALKLAGGAGTLRCLDLVPHNIHELFEYPELAEFLGHADIVISNARTLAAPAR
jgi:sugar/nucleoside kinase (ribokinase family)